MITWDRIASALRDGPRCCASLAMTCRVSGSKLSPFLGKLKRMGLITNHNNLWSRIDG